MPDESEDDVITTARVNRCHDSTPLGIGLYISGPQLLRLGIDPVETGAVDVEIEGGRLRKQFGLEKGTKLLVVPMDYGLVLRKLELPSVEEFQERVEDRAKEVELSMEDIDELVHESSTAEQ